MISKCSLPWHLLSSETIKKATAKASTGSLAQHLRPEGGLFWVPLGEHLVW